MKALYDVPAPAKLNLFLHILGRRADGYHDLQSVFVPIDWCDTLHFERRDDGLLRRHDLGPSLPEDDLCLRAARLLQHTSGCNLGVDLSIDKQVPWGAGMGGGSSDAATTLLALNRLWQLDWPLARLQPLARQLGADVPFFLGEKAAWVEGIGDRLTPIDLPPMRFAVLKPGASLPTASIFQSPHLVRDTKAATLAVFLAETAALDQNDRQTGRSNRCEAFGRNDMQAAAQALCSDVSEAAQWLQARYGNSRMTGSGSAVFARIGTDDPLPEALDALPAEWQVQGWQGRMCRSLQRLPLWGWAAS